MYYKGFREFSMNVSYRKYPVILSISFLTLRYQYKEIMKGFPHIKKKMEPRAYFLAEMCIVDGCLQAYFL